TGAASGASRRAGANPTRRRGRTPGEPLPHDSRPDRLLRALARRAGAGARARARVGRAPAPPARLRGAARGDPALRRGAARGAARAGARRRRAARARGCGDGAGGGGRLRDARRARAAGRGDRRGGAQLRRRSRGDGDPGARRPQARATRQRGRAHRPHRTLSRPDHPRAPNGALRGGLVSRVRRILVPLDFSKHSDAALELAIELARELGAEIHLLHAYELPAAVTMAYGIAIPQAVWDGVQEAARKRLADGLARLEQAGVPGESHLAT